MRLLPAATLYTVTNLLSPSNGCSCTSTSPTPTTAPITAAWDLSPRPLAFELVRDGQNTETQPVTLDIGPFGLTTVDVAGALTPAQLDAQGVLLPTTAAGELPVALDLLSAAPRAGALRIGGTSTFRHPSDAQLRDDELTVQSEVTVELVQVSGPVATYAVSSSYRVVDNGALAAFRQAVGHDPSIEAVLDGALDWRLSLVGELQFDLTAGALIEAEATTAGLPLTDLTPATLRSHPDALTYTLTLR